MRLIPDKILPSVGDITPEMLIGEDVKGLVLDIDNTLAPRHVALPDESIIKWIKSMKKAGTKLYIISNNRTNRVTKFAKALGLPFRCNGLKPFPRAFHLAVREMGIDARYIVAVGDQIYTDVMGAHAAGIRAWLVMPMDPHENPFTRLRRQFEKPFLKRYYKDRKTAFRNKKP